jgi:predicted  nucleic acid-binding Zn-ribbon protein
MADLSTIANETVTKFTTLFEKTEQIQTDLDEFQEQLATLSEEELSAETQQNTDAMTQLRNKITATRDELDQDLELVKETVVELANKVDAVIPEVEAAFQASEESFTLLAETILSLETELESVTSEANGFLADQVTTELAEHQSNIEDKVVALETTVTEECLPQIAHQVETLSHHITDMVEQMSTMLQNAGEQTEQSAQSTLDQISQFQRNEITELLDTVNQLAELMQRLSDLIDGTTDTVMNVKDGMLTAVNTTNIGLNAAVGIFEDVLEILSI